MSFVDKIKLEIIEPTYRTEIIEFINSRRRWRSSGIIFQTCSKLCLGVGSILSFSSGIYLEYNLNFYAGTITTLALIALQFSSFSFRESKLATKELNILLKTLKIEDMPDVLSSVKIEDNSKIDNTETNISS
jgi:hypothetical protein